MDYDLIQTKSSKYLKNTIYFKSSLNYVIKEYKYPNTFNTNFLRIDWLSRKFIHLLDHETLFNIILRILL